MLCFLAASLSDPESNDGSWHKQRQNVVCGAELTFPCIPCIPRGSGCSLGIPGTLKAIKPDLARVAGDEVISSLREH